MKELIQVAKNRTYDSKVIAQPCERHRDKADHADKLLSRFKHLGKVRADKVVKQVRGYERLDDKHMDALLEEKERRYVDHAMRR